jgi:hypothetical protein
MLMLRSGAWTGEPGTHQSEEVVHCISSGDGGT